MTHPTQAISQLDIANKAQGPSTFPRTVTDHFKNIFASPGVLAQIPTLDLGSGHLSLSGALSDNPQKLGLAATGTTYLRPVDPTSPVLSNASPLNAPPTREAAYMRIASDVAPRHAPEFAPANAVQHDSLRVDRDACAAMVLLRMLVKSGNTRGAREGEKGRVATPIVSAPKRVRHRPALRHRTCVLERPSALWLPSRTGPAVAAAAAECDAQVINAAGITYVTAGAGAQEDAKSAYNSPWVPAAAPERVLSVSAAFSGRPGIARHDAESRAYDPACPCCVRGIPPVSRSITRGWRCRPSRGAQRALARGIAHAPVDK
ncbi:hypothetical protein HYPSUDRAFT_206528 [Hypholoma sublateritium FD-334 SS-4]|uniref:Uncharacterized protein n=1 Tax=Hypholoma sublateritium (strain FD-334 SS-4) TaxID=945553 RepID=A0A0D2KR10_HYPSF|nr:hypothetical protein HYPSUDRAFT_206528 [Hypholoma sublateritium FD-334 SS-4]